jgi:hypothetical protein
MAVAGIPRHQAELDQRVERPPERVAPDSEALGERDEPASSLSLELGEYGRRPTVVEEGDEQLD